MHNRLPHPHPQIFVLLILMQESKVIQESMKITFKMTPSWVMDRSATCSRLQGAEKGARATGSKGEIVQSTGEPRHLPRAWVPVQGGWLHSGLLQWALPQRGGSSMISRSHGLSWDT